MRRKTDKDPPFAAQLNSYVCADGGYHVSSFLLSVRAPVELGFCLGGSPSTLDEAVIPVLTRAWKINRRRLTSFAEFA
ncbi:hypothetical protein BaRGS_00007397 [Batillaria attramentaria]|uniref:Uncharacterized protein n=1 Tax=Batillaria attramentaria TaxID=370345 RepID=A0ABD0LNV6_9CAEN